MKQPIEKPPKSARVYLKRQIEKLRLDEYPEFHEAFVSWIWPESGRFDRFRGTYARNERYWLHRGHATKGLPRYSIDMFLKHDCQQKAVTKELPALTGYTFKEGVVHLSRSSTQNRQSMYKSHRYITSLPNTKRLEYCNAIKSQFQFGHRSGWSELYTDDMLRYMYSLYMADAEQKLRTFIANPDTYTRFARDIYTAAMTLRIQQWIDLYRDASEVNISLPSEYKPCLHGVGGLAADIKALGKERQWTTRPKTKPFPLDVDQIIHYLKVHTFPSDECQRMYTQAQQMVTKEYNHMAASMLAQMRHKS